MAWQQMIIRWVGGVVVVVVVVVMGMVRWGWC
jgi:hypothetical protein